MIQSKYTPRLGLKNTAAAIKLRRISPLRVRARKIAAGTELRLVAAVEGMRASLVGEGLARILEKGDGEMLATAA